MIPCISEVCTLPASFAEDLAAFRDAGCPSMEVWLTKLEQHLENHSLESTRNLVTQAGVRLVAAGLQGGLLVSQGEARKSAFDLFRRRLDLCRELAIPTMVLTGDFTHRPNDEDVARSIVSLNQAAQWAAAFDVRVALEFRGTDQFCNCLATALMLVEQAAEPNLGICLDVYHFYKGLSKAEDLEQLNSSNLYHVQLCDVAGVPRELMSDSDRVFPGEGDFCLGPIIQHLNRIGYGGSVSLEVMNPNFWRSKPTQVVELGWKALERWVRETT